MKPISKSLHALKHRLETKHTISSHRSSAIDTLCSNGFVREALELLNCGEDRRRLLQTVNRLIREWPGPAMIQLSDEMDTTKAKLTEAEKNAIAWFWHQELEEEFDDVTGGGPTWFWRWKHGVTKAEFHGMVHLLGKELEAEGKNEIEKPTEPFEIPWTNAEEFRARYQQLRESSNDDLENLQS